jgi:hypothetical protein
MQMVSSDVKCLLLTTEIQIVAYILGYLTGQRWGAPTVLTQKCMNS